MRLSDLSPNAMLEFTAGNLAETQFNIEESWTTQKIFSVLLEAPL
jgi:hypothetical protein